MLKRQNNRNLLLCYCILRIYPGLLTVGEYERKWLCIVGNKGKRLLNKVVDHATVSVVLVVKRGGL